jgi:hypothetical protein
MEIFPVHSIIERWYDDYNEFLKEVLEMTFQDNT